MSALWIDAPTGLAGDMLLAALLDLGVDQAVVESPLAALGLTGRYRLTQQEARSAGLRGIRVDVEGLEDQPPHRHWSGIRDQINAAALAPSLKQRVLAVFTRLAEAEATVHGTPVEAVHFHEVGAIDALVDVVGVCAAIDDLNPARIVCSPLPAGSGTVATAHGLLPVPVPAVLELARRHRIPLLQGGDLPTGELVTPTGLALVSVLADQFVAPERLVADKVGVGLGRRQHRLVGVRAEAGDQHGAAGGLEHPGIAIIDASVHHHPRITPAQAAIIRAHQFDTSEGTDVALPAPGTHQQQVSTDPGCKRRPAMVAIRLKADGLDFLH